jgi:adenylate kinase family enzyme
MTVMNKIIVLGSSGSGKSTLARRLGELLDLEVIHLDSYYWQPNWTATPEDEWAKKVSELLERDRWVMDGNYPNSLRLRMGYADTAIFLDHNRWICFWRCIKRFGMYRGENRSELAEGCNEKIDLDFIKWIWNYPRDVKPTIVSLLEEDSEKNVIWLKSSQEVTRYLNQIKTKFYNLSSD